MPCHVFLFINIIVCHFFVRIRLIDDLPIKPELLKLSIFEILHYFSAGLFLIDTSVMQTALGILRFKDEPSIVADLIFTL